MEHIIRLGTTRVGQRGSVADLLTREDGGEREVSEVWGIL